MDLKLKGKTALITGGSEGIGKGIARLFAKEGVDVAICARRKEPLEATAKEIAKEFGTKVIPIPADLRKDADAKAFIEQAHKALGRIDIMVNNAGSAAGGVIEHLTEDDWEKGLQLKFMGYVRCLRYVLPIMVKQGGGRVVNLIGNDGVKPSYWEICPGAANAAGQNNQASPSAVIAQGVFAILGTNMTYEVIQTTPALTGVSAPTAAGGFGSTTIAGARNPFFIQKYVKQ